MRRVRSRVVSGQGFGENISKVSLMHSHRIGGNKTADDDAAAVMYVPHHVFADRVAAVADDGVRWNLHPLALDRHPIGALAEIIFGAVTVGDVAAGHAVRRHHALEPGADVGRDVFVLPVVEGESRAREHGQTRQQRDLREPSHAILHSVASASWRAAFARHESPEQSNAIKPEPSGGCMLKKYADISRLRD